jgi:hypothetical protein
VLQDLRLDGVGVLVLIDQDAVETLADGAARVAVGQEFVPVQQEVVEVEDVLLAFAFGIGVE